MSGSRAKPLYQPWNEEEFRADFGVCAMTPVQRWMYRTCLQSAFFCSTRPYLPDDDAQLWMLAGCANRREWDANSDTVRAMFTPTEIDGVKLLGQKRLLADWNRLEQKRQVLAENGRRSWGGRGRRSGGSPNGNQLPSICSANAEQGSKEVKEVSKPSSSKTETVFDGRSTPKAKQEPDGFAEFWKRYPRKVAKQDAMKAWRKLTGIDLQTILAALDRATCTDEWTKDGGRFIPHPASWLNGRRWEDELTGAPARATSVPQRRTNELTEEARETYRQFGVTM